MHGGTTKLKFFDGRRLIEYTEEIGLPRLLASATPELGRMFNHDIDSTNTFVQATSFAATKKQLVGFLTRLGSTESL